MADFIISYAVKLKQPYFNETNPVYILTGSMLPLLALKIIMVVVISYIFIKKYHKVPIYARYLLTTILFIGIIAQMAVIPNATKEYSKPPEEVINIPVEQRAQHYKQNIINPMVIAYVLLMTLFIFWNVIEEESKNDRGNH